MKINEVIKRTDPGPAEKIELAGEKLVNTKAQSQRQLNKRTSQRAESRT
jgi:uncharacterized membrane protein